MKICVFFGNIGVGKSTWLRALKEHKYNTVEEDLTKVLFLENYWEHQRKITPYKQSRNKYAFRTQVGFYSSWLNQYNKAKKIGDAFLDNTILSHHSVFTEYMYENSIINNKEYEQLSKIYLDICSIVHIDHCFYLYCDKDENMQRISIRNRNIELNNEEYIAILQQKYDSVYTKLAPNITKVDITKMNPYDIKDFKRFCTILKMEGIELADYLRRD